MGINKVVFYGNTLVDLTKLTVEENSLLKNYKAIDRAGDEITGRIPVYTASVRYSQEGNRLFLPEGCYRVKSSSDYTGEIELHLSDAGVPTFSATRLDANTIRVFAEFERGGCVASGKKYTEVIDVRTLMPTDWEVDVLSIAYPVGSIYMSLNDTDPAELFGGTWERLKDTFLLAAGDTYAAGSEGGEAEHALTIDEMPSHNHGFKVRSNALGSGSTYARIASDGTATNNVVTDEGGGVAHNNMPPYFAVYMWKRTA